MGRSNFLAAKIAAIPVAYKEPATPGTRKRVVKRKERRKQAGEAAKLKALQKGLAVGAAFTARRMENLCVVCQKPLHPGHVRHHRNLLKAISPADGSNSQPKGASIWAVSGGLPSLGKRSR